MMRVTQQTLARQTLFDLNGTTNRLAQLQQQLSTGKQITRPEDDPFGTGRALSLRDELADTQQFQRNINDGVAWLQQSDTALGNANDVVSRVRTLVVQAGNGTNDAGALKAIQTEISQLKESLREQSNTTLDGRYVFAGTQTKTPPFPAPGNSFAGNTNLVQRQIGPGQTVAVSQDATAAFGPNGDNVFDLLDRIQADLSSGNTSNLQGRDLSDIDTAMDRIQSGRSNVGATQNRLTTQLSRLKDAEVNVSDLLSKTEDADMAKTMVNFSMTQTVYQAALQAGAKVIQPTLMDFLG
jgi:flagellar hook-associated protein 3 FlgL